MKIKKLFNIAVLRCTGCKTEFQQEVSKLPKHEPPYCPGCFFPAIVTSVILNSKVFPVKRP